VLGPDPFAANDSRDIVAMYPEDYRTEARSFARGDLYGVAWRDSNAPLVARCNLADVPGAAKEDGWAAAWMSRGVESITRVDIPTALGNGFECVMFAARQTDRADSALMAWSAMSVWPLIKSQFLAQRYGISAREHEVLVALAKGLTAQEVADRIDCSPRTVNFHATNVALKLRAPNRAATIQLACALGLV
jgi:DNA-binding CsgD family transcriptional regulator